MEQPLSGPAVRYESNVPGEISSVVEPLLRKWLHLVPTWCHHIRIRYDSTDNQNNAQTRSFSEYRDSRIAICSGFLDLTPDERERCVAHELIHLLLEPLQNAHADALDVIKAKAPDVYDLALENRRHATEAVVSDILHMVRAPATRRE